MDGRCRSTSAVCPQEADCGGRECGRDPVCGTSCGTCSGAICNTQGRCVTEGGCTQGETRCTGDGHGFEACGTEPGSQTASFGPRVPCAAADSCQAGSGSCNRGACLETETIVLLDRSSSMLSGGTWSWVREAVLQSLQSREFNNAFGFRQFPSGDGCSVGSLVGLARDNGDNIAARMDDPSSGASTPIRAALANLRTAYGDPNDGQAVILISDGDETCDAAADAVDEASALFRAGVRVYAIAVTTTANRSLLDQIAWAGGTDHSRLVSSHANLVNALDEIFADLGACDPVGWSCSRDFYGAGDGCDCGCGDHDPDCQGADCVEPGCAPPSGGVCEYCYGAEAEQIDCDPCVGCIRDNCSMILETCINSEECSTLYMCYCGDTYDCSAGCAGDTACVASCQTGVDPEVVNTMTEVEGCVWLHCSGSCQL